MAQTSGDEPLPVPQSRPSVESYSLPPGPNSNPKQQILQGPVDAEIPLTGPATVAPRTAPAKAPPPLRTPETGNPPAAPATIDSTANRVQPPVRQAPPRPEATDEKSAPDTGSSPILTEPTTTVGESRGSTAVPADANSPPTTPLTEPVPEKAANDWMLLAFAALLFVLLGALFLWRARRATPKQAFVTEPDRARPDLTGAVAETPGPLPPAPAITIGFQPRSANATLFNAVLGFELTLTNHGSEDLADIRVNGAMGQAEDHGTRDPLAADLLPLQEVPRLQTGGTEKIITEFRVPLAGIRPIQFGSQALFVPLVQISIAWTDGSGAPHLQTAAFLIGQEHQPPRPKMAPFRLDLGPRSFAPLGHRPITSG